MDGQHFFKGAIIIYVLLIFWIVWYYSGVMIKDKISDDEIESKPTIRSNSLFNTTLHVTTSTVTPPTDIRGLLPHYLGPGANGDVVAVPKNDDNYTELRQKYLKYQVNNFLTNIVGLKRIQPDRRPEVCKQKIYPSDLPAVSIILTFRDEPFVTLLRTVYSILETSPTHLIKEIILVDDGSEDEELLSAVKVHAANVDKLKLIRNERSLGLMRARQRGILSSEADYFIVMDGHVEATPGWLEPIMYRLKTHPKSLLTSHIGIVKCEDFGFFLGHHEDFVLLFDQVSLNEHWVRYKPEYLKYRNGSVEPIPYGMVPGMMMSMKKSFFLDLGGFDLGMEVWGAEHMEMSVKVWLCGGRVEMVPCSKLGHLYRPAPWHKFTEKKDYVLKNLLRFTLVWMDGYMQEMALHTRRSDNETKMMERVGDISERLQIKSDQKCKPYQSFIDLILNTFAVYVPVNPKAKGVIKNRSRKQCLDRSQTDGRFSLILYPCNGNVNQFIILTEDSCLRADRTWFVVEPGSDNIHVKMDESVRDKDESKWSYESNGNLKHIKTGKCLTASYTDKISLDSCTDTQFQQWDWETMS
ncbi:polypeptide N-acetylgalactosaminyltransferase [Mactra antiquata]